jgi:hypothetical protein
MGSNPTSTACDQARCATLVPTLCVPGKHLSQFWPRNGRCSRSGPRFLPQVRAVSGHPARAGLQHLRSGVSRITFAPRVLRRPGHMEREPAAH